LTEPDRDCAHRATRAVFGDVSWEATHEVPRTPNARPDGEIELAACAKRPSPAAAFGAGLMADARPSGRGESRLSGSQAEARIGRPATVANVTGAARRRRPI